MSFLSRKPYRVALAVMAAAAAVSIMAGVVQ